jgi:hypothetical protein
MNPQFLVIQCITQTLKAKPKPPHILYEIEIKTTKEKVYFVRNSMLETDNSILININMILFAK